jgi:predicted outer membrane repeat protein
VGGGMLCERASPRIKDCVFSGNAAEIGGGVFCDKGSSPRFNDCIFSGNWAYTYGGAIFCDSRYEPALVRCAFLLNCADAQGGAVCTGWSSRIAVSNCTFYANAAQHGGAIHQGEEASVSMENTIIAFGNRGGAWSCHSSSSDIIIRCSDIYENAGGDWVWWIADMDTVYGNLCEDPLFCDPENGDFRLQTCSPCVPGHHPRGHDCGGLIGARGVGCDCRNPDAPRTEMGVLGFSD